MPHPCFGKIKDSSLVKHLLEKSSLEDKDTYTPEEIQKLLKASEEIQNEDLVELNDIYADLKIKGYERTTPEPATKSVPSTPTVQEGKGEQPKPSIVEEGEKPDLGISEKGVTLPSGETATTNTPLQAEGTYSEEGRKAIANTKQQPQQKEKKLTERLAAIDIEGIRDPYDKVLNYFASKGKIHPSAIQQIFGTKGRTPKSVEGEKRTRIGMLGKNAPTIDGLAHQIWEDMGSPEDISTMEIRDAVESVILSHNSWSSAAKELTSKYDFDALYERYMETPEDQELIELAEKLTDEEINHILELDSQKNKEQELEDYINSLTSPQPTTEGEIIEAQPELPEAGETKKTTQDIGNQPPTEPPIGEGEKKPPRDNKAILNRLYESKNIKEGAKKRFEEEGLSYEPKSQDEARELAKSIVDEFGVDDAVLFAEAGRFGGDVNTWIFGEALNRFQEQEATSKTMQDEFENGLKWSETAIKFDEYGRKLGRGISAIYDFYKKSPIGVALKENNNRKQIFEDWYKGKEKGFKEFFDELQKDPDFKEFFEKEVGERLKKERTEARKSRIKKVDDSIDAAINKLKNGGTLYSSIVPPQVFVVALEGVKKAYHAGEAVAKIVNDAIDYVSKQLGTGDWDKDKFTDYVNKIIGEKGKRIITDEEKKQRILDKFRKKLVGLNEQQKREVVERSMKHILDNGALDYPDLKKIIAEVIGIKELTEADVQKIKNLQAKINKIQESAKQARESRTGDLTEFRKTVKEGELAQQELDAIIYQRAQPLTRFLDIVKLNTLGVVSLIKNVAYNIGWQPIRFGKSVFKTALDYSGYGISLLANKTFGTKMLMPEDNVFLAQKGFFTQMAVGLKRAGLQFRTGLQDRDYYSRETFQGKIKPFQSWRDLWKWKKGELFLTNKQVADKLMQGTGGINAEFISRSLNIGDKWLKFGAEGAKAEQIAKLELGIDAKKNPADMKLFMQFPKEEAYRIFKERKFSDEEAQAKAEDVEKRIQTEGERAILQNDTWLNNMLSSMDKFLNDKTESSDSVKSIAAGTVKVLKALSIPYVKIPINVGWNIINLTNPELALAQSALYGYGAIRATDPIKADSQRRLSKDYLATAAVGFGLKLAAASLVSLGLIRPRNDDEEKYKEKEGEAFYGRQNSFNWSGIKRLAIGGDPTPKEGDVWVDLSWLGVFGGILNVHSNIEENKQTKISRGVETDESYLDDLMARLEGSVSEGFQNGVFSGTNNLINATKNGGGYVDNLFLNYLNMGINFFEPATYAQFSKAMQDERTTYRADSFWEKLKNNQEQRDILYRTFISKEKAPLKISIWGEPIKNGTTIQNMLGFAPDDRNKFGILLWDDYQRTKDERFFPQPTPQSIDVDGKSTKLSTKEAEDLAVIVGQNRKSGISAFVYNQVNYGGKSYDGLSDEEKIKAIQNIYRQASELGFDEFKQRYPQYQKAEKDKFLEAMGKSKTKIFNIQIEQKIKSK